MHFPVVTSRRQFLAMAAMSAGALQAQRKNVPVGLQLFAVGRNAREDLTGTLRALAGMGYTVVEFSAPQYLPWSPAEAKKIRALMDELHLSCHSTHNEIVSFTGDGLSKAIELNQIIGSKTLVAVRGPAGPSRDQGPTLDQWKKFSDTLSAAAQKLQSAKMTVGFHNHGIEFQKVEGTYPADLLAANKDIKAHHLNVGLALQGGGDPAAFIKKCPGRLQSVLLQDYKGQAKWKEIFTAAESNGALEFYLIQRADGLGLVERKGTDPLENVKLDLQDFKKMQG